MVTAISDMENPLEENDHAILTNAEEDEDIPFTVDEVLIRSGAPNGMELFSKDKKYFGEVPDTRRTSKTDSFRGYSKIFIDSVEALEEGEQYMTQNGNKLFKVSDDELILVSITTGKTVHIPIIFKVKNMSIVPVLLDRHAIDPTVNTTAEAVIEDLTGVTLYSGISLFEEKSERGKVIFSLKELPVGVTFKHIDTSVTIERSPSNEILINGQLFLPAKEEQLLSGSSLLVKSPSQESSPNSSRRNSANKLPMMTSEMPNPSIHILESSLNDNKEKQDDDEEEDKDDFSVYLHHVDSVASSAFKKFFLLSEVPSYEEPHENPQVEEQIQLERTKRVSKYMNRVEQYYLSTDGSTNVIPFTSQYEDKFYSSTFIKALQTFVHDKESLNSKSQLQFSKYLEKYQDL